jgi:hypothetical protein
MSQITRMAVQRVAVDRVERTLAQTEPSAAALLELQRLLEQEAEAPLLRIAARGERAGMDRLMLGFQTGEVNDSQRLGMLPIDNSSVPVAERLAHRAPGAAAVERAAVLRFMTRLVEAAKLPPPKLRAKFRELDGELDSRQQPTVVRFLVPPFGQVIRAYSLSQAQLGCAGVAVAAERYRRDQGRWPESIAALVKAGLLKEVPTDPFDGQPLHWRPLPDGIVIYSVGPDEKDDGGNLDRKSPPREGTDLGFQLWDVPHRRQPPQLAKDPENPDPPP